MDTEKKKARKGTVSLQDLDGRRRFKYRYNKKVFYLTLPLKGDLKPEFEELIRKIIESDTSTNRHDNTQEKYKNLIKKGVVSFKSNDPAFSDIIKLDYEITIFGFRIKE